MILWNQAIRGFSSQRASDVENSFKDYTISPQRSYEGVIVMMLWNEATRGFTHKGTIFRRCHPGDFIIMHALSLTRGACAYTVYTYTLQQSLLWCTSWRTCRTCEHPTATPLSQQCVLDKNTRNIDTIPGALIWKREIPGAQHSIDNPSKLILNWSLVKSHMCLTIIIPPATKFRGGILDSPCSSVRLSVCLSVCPSVCLSVRPSVRPSVRGSVSGW